MQILHPFAGSVQHYLAQLAATTADQRRPIHCPQCQAKDPLKAHGFYTRTLIDTGFDGAIRIRRYLCQAAALSHCSPVSPCPTCVPVSP